jgi:peptidoglycan/LPS O-acetylase OafA/YrhL
MQNGTFPRLTALDGIRGLTALFVCFEHFAIGFDSALLDSVPKESHFPWDMALSHTVLSFVYDPDVGLFFVLSGFVLAAATVAEPAPFWRLAVRRYIRLILPVFIVTILIFLLLHLGTFHNCAAAARLSGSGWMSYIYVPYCFTQPLGDMLFAVLFKLFIIKLNGHFVTGQITYILTMQNPVLWTIPIELVGSLGVFLFYRLRGPYFAQPWACLLIALAAVVISWQSKYWGFGCGLAIFELRRVLLTTKGPHKTWAQPLGAALMAFGLWLSACPVVYEAPHVFLIHLLAPLPFHTGVDEIRHAGNALVIAAALFFRPAQRLLNTRLCQFLGRISFMMYLIQIPVLGAVGASVLVWVTPHFGYGAAFLAALLAFIGSNIVLAELFTRWLDRPAIRLSHMAMYFPKRRL